VTKAQRSGRRRKPTRLAIDPFFACLIFAGVGLGTLALATSARLVVLWTTLLVLWLACREGKTLKLKYEFMELGRGALIGLAIGLPLMLLAFRSLVEAIPILFMRTSPTATSGAGGTTVFVSLVLLAPVAEELFFRDLLQREHGLWLGAGLYAAGGLILFLPTAGKYPVVLLAVVGSWAILGVIYSALFERLGLAATLASHLTINLFMLFGPAIGSQFGLITR
jgi:membrane protease YdiL (CAAX protease family)